MTKPIVMSVKKLPNDIYKRLLYLNMHSNGIMQSTLFAIRKYPQDYDSKAEVAYLEIDGQIVSWALYTYNEIHVYTRRGHRKKGYGTKVLRRIAPRHKGADVYETAYNLLTTTQQKYMYLTF